VQIGALLALRSLGRFLRDVAIHSEMELVVIAIFAASPERSRSRPLDIPKKQKEIAAERPQVAFCPKLRQFAL